MITSPECPRNHSVSAAPSLHYSRPFIRFLATRTKHPRARTMWNQARKLRKPLPLSWVRSWGWHPAQVCPPFSWDLIYSQPRIFGHLELVRKAVIFNNPRTPSLWSWTKVSPRPILCTAGVLSGLRGYSFHLVPHWVHPFQMLISKLEVNMVLARQKASPPFCHQIMNPPQKKNLLPVRQ